MLAAAGAAAACRSAAPRAPASGAPTSSVAACHSNAALVARLQRVVDSLVATRADLHGVALAVDAPGRCLSRAFVAGTADPGTGAPLTAATPVRIASNTKTYVAAAVLRLVEDGRVGLDDPIARYVAPEDAAILRRGGYDPGAITVHQLLGHTGGLYDYAMDSTYLAAVVGDPTRRWTRADQLRVAVTRGTPYGPPGRVFHYSDTGYILLGELLERVTGQPLGTALRALLDYRRLGLDATWLESLEPAPAGVPPRAHQFFGARDTFAWDPSMDLYGGGGLAASVGDMTRFTRALLTGRVFHRPTTLALMETNLVPGRIGGVIDYRLGLYARELGGARAWGHSGFWNTFAYYVPALDLALAGAALQQQAGDASGALAREAVEAVRAVR